MNNHRLYPRHTSLAGAVLRVRHSYVNAQGVELTEARIFSRAADVNV